MSPFRRNRARRRRIPGRGRTVVNERTDVGVSGPFLRCAVALMLAMSAASLSACSPPPALPKAELDAKKLPQKHPKMTEVQKKECRSCHKEAPAIRN